MLLLRHGTTPQINPDPLQTQEKTRQALRKGGKGGRRPSKQSTYNGPKKNAKKAARPSTSQRHRPPRQAFDHPDRSFRDTSQYAAAIMKTAYYTLHPPSSLPRLRVDQADRERVLTCMVGPPRHPNLFEPSPPTPVMVRGSPNKNNEPGSDPNDQYAVTFSERCHKNILQHQMLRIRRNSVNTFGVNKRLQTQTRPKQGAARHDMAWHHSEKHLRKEQLRRQRQQQRQRQQ